MCEDVDTCACARQMMCIGARCDAMHTHARDQDPEEEYQPKKRGAAGRRGSKTLPARSAKAGKKVSVRGCDVM